MYDIFNSRLEKEAVAQGLTRVPVSWIEKPGTMSGFLGARTTEPWIFKAGVRIVTDLENEPRKDSLHHRSSGLDSTTARLCAENNILVAINLAILRTLDPIIIGRTMQNIVLCRRYKARMCVISNARTIEELPHAHDVHGLLVSLGMSQGEATAALDALEKAYTEYRRTR